ncbi:hypothetical protein [Natronobacterium gregoryi]|uniref:Uncharacterized protein n=2 Tax=Natronobacterium gregoryi TaxID=44930 RepID=L0AF02_NATGS|nr:hypothetical protein [Natronobacterium gregoryi]AFZ72421.1 hypothetical protein Natgr_1197 [Natronobacterium gregoryi SP2]ELY64674.1 hypothetical protein C490_14440 [Natronobacterium gregoryi SP2]PLK19257.1 hypothetical protein CYV19_15870 [Natronobacterium gregoryi SP2]SFJ56022.1 hypothetical protein SAMN05443661_13914 [Natronobacterium gregoryi]
MRRSIAVGGAILAVAFLFVGGPSLLFSPSADQVSPDTTDRAEPEIVTLEDSDSGFWPYLNQRQQHEKRSPLNVVVRGDAEETFRLLAEHGDGEWEEADHDHFEAEELVGLADGEDETPGNETGDANVTGDVGTDSDDPLRPVSPTDIPWSQADGATRYAYLDPGPDEEADWTTETVQFEDGEYYGYRYHIRAYESPNPDDQWVVMQTHSEHFDWFTLRHRVDGVERAQLRLETDLMAIPGVDVQDDVRRVYLDNSGPSDADGWATKVDLTAMATASVGLALASGRSRKRDDGVLERAGDRAGDRLTDADRARLEAAADRVEAEHLILAGTILAVVLGVRIGGIALDRTVGVLTPHMIAALLYPFVAVGLPVATYAIASGLERRLDAGVTAAASLAIAIWLDYGLVGVDVLPLDVVGQRLLVVLALGLIAAGAARRAVRGARFNDLLFVGVGLWVVVLVGTLLGYL